MAFSSKFLLLLLFLFGSDILGNKTTNADCHNCKILTESFNNWLDKTSRGKYEGGDAAWEEKKLKSYSRSEIRLVEIQESLCSELKTHKDSCYVLAEEIEQVLEKWWFNEDPNSVDLYTWLCIENLKYCCPVSHFGEACSPCSKDKENKVCGGHGKCDGDGTRKGNGTCLCNRGHSGRLCGDCEVNFYSTTSGTCEKCHESCNGCHGNGATSCDICNTGWDLKSGECVDINECRSSVCKVNQYCTNTEGSYVCKECDNSCKSCSGDSSSKCISCEHPNVLWFGMCVDDEMKQSSITNTFRRLALYIGLLCITLFIFRTSTSVSSIVMFIIAIFIYFAERNLKMKSKDVLLHILQNPN